jgi:hypothetical protein
MLSEVGILKTNVARQIVNAIIAMLQAGVEQREIELDTKG